MDYGQNKLKKARQNARVLSTLMVVKRGGGTEGDGTLEHNRCGVERKSIWLRRENDLSEA